VAGRVSGDLARRQARIMNLSMTGANEDVMRGNLRRMELSALPDLACVAGDQDSDDAGRQRGTRVQKAALFPVAL
jgi:hypothetical protein